MKLVHFESGLGNQMLNYAEFLAMQYANPNDKVFSERFVFDIPETERIATSFDGYQLKKIFGIEIPDIREVMNEEQVEEVEKKIRSSKFWDRDWDYPIPICSSINSVGFSFENRCISKYVPLKKRKKNLIYYLFRSNKLGGSLELLIKNIFKQKYSLSKAAPEELFISSDKDVYMGQTLRFMYNGNNICSIDTALRRAFIFPDFSIDSYGEHIEGICKKNEELAERIKNTESVSIHLRRGDIDAMNNNGYLFKNGYFNRAVRYIKEKVNNPFFFIFSDEGSIQWCKKNMEEIFLNKTDNIEYIGWNRGKDSYRDMQLMSLCKHNIIMFSSFGWWASFLNNNKDKITISPRFNMNTTMHC